MLVGFVTKKPSSFDDVIDRVVSDLMTMDMDSDEYARRLSYLERLNQMKETELPNRVSPDTMAIVAANLLGILIIVGYERANVLASRGLGLILRTRHQ